jgi:predicted nucleic acid-binding protein
MTTGAVERLFVDTNVLVYANVAEAPFHTEARTAIRTYEDQGVTLWISRQIIREYLATLTRPNLFETSPDITTLQTQVHAFMQRFQIAEDGPQITATLLNLLAAVAVGGAQVHDANVVATMQVYGLTHLLTHNVEDFDRFRPYITMVSLVT